MVEQCIQGTDIFLVEVSVKPGNMITVHVDEPEGIAIQECVKISRHINGILDKDVEDYSLQVSSPGLGSPFKVKQQYEKNAGRSIEVRLSDGTAVTGKVQSVSDSGIILEVKGSDEEVKFEEISKSKAIISFN